MSDVELPQVVVLGTGAAGLTAALAAAVGGARVRVIEKAPTVGGTTAVSGGVVWIPVHDRPDENGPLTAQDARAYLESLSLGRMEPELIETFIENGQAMIDMVEQNSPVRFEIAAGFPDYYPEKPGGRPHGGRSLNPTPFSFDELGDWADRVTAFPVDSLTFGFDIETRQRLRVSVDDETLAQMAATNGKMMGAALIGGLLKALLDRGIEPETDTRAVGLVQEAGAVVGVEVERGDARETISADSVIMATGGFEWDPALVTAFLRGPMVGPVSPPANTGDGLRMAIKAGADLGNMGDAWWVPVIQVPGDSWRGAPRSRSIRLERTRPRSIIVNRAGRRFVNEALNYNSMATAFHDMDRAEFEYANLPAWLIIDSVHLERYGFLGVEPGGEPLEYFTRSESLDELAGRLGIDADGLTATVERWNEMAAAGEDLDFGRGASAHDGWWGDWAGATTASRTLGPIDTAPFFAVPVYPGALGTKGGPRVDSNGRVRHVDGGVIPGLFAAGNVAAGVTAYAYGGAGGTIGPAMVWGYLAGTAAAGRGGGM